MSNPFVTHPVVSSLVELLGITMFAVAHGAVAVTTAITEADWSKLIGPHGALFVMALGLIALWWKANRDNAERIKESEAKERRHLETLASSEKHFQTLIAMNRENALDLKQVSLDSVRAQVEGTEAIRNLSRELSARPCGIARLQPMPNQTA